MLTESCSHRLVEPQKAGFQRMSRTDKGVHASLSAVSIKADILPEFITQPEATDDQDVKKGKVDLMHCINHEKIISKINLVLQADSQPIRIFGLRLLKKKYNLRKRVYERTYNYFIPISMFQTVTDNKGGAVPFQTSRDEILELVNKVMPRFLGVNAYHSYTNLRMLGNIKIKFDPEGKLPPKADQLSRNIKDFSATTLDQNESWIRIKIQGASFLYNQIRCMIGSLVQGHFYFGNEVDKISEFVDSTFKKRVQVWRVPGEGLYLEGFDGDLGEARDQREGSKANKWRNHKDKTVKKLKTDSNSQQESTPEERLGELKQEEQLAKTQFFCEFILPDLVDIHSTEIQISAEKESSTLKHESVFKEWLEEKIVKDWRMRNPEEGQHEKIEDSDGESINGSELST